MNLFDYPFAPQQVLPFFPSYRAGILNHCIGSSIISIMRIAQTAPENNGRKTTASILLVFDNGISLLFFASDTVNSILVHRQTSERYYYSFNGNVSRGYRPYELNDPELSGYKGKKIGNFFVCGPSEQENKKALKKNSQCAIKIALENGSALYLAYSLDQSGYFELLSEGSFRHELNCFSVKDVVNTKEFCQQEEFRNTIPEKSSDHFKTGSSLHVPFYNFAHIRKNTFLEEDQLPELGISAKNYLYDLKNTIQENDFSIIDLGFEMDQNRELKINTPVEIFPCKSPDNKDANMNILNSLLHQI